MPTIIEVYGGKGPCSGAFYGFTGMCDSPATRPDGNQKRLESFSKILARQPSGVHQQEIVNTSQFNLEALEQFLCGVVQL